MDKTQVESLKISMKELESIIENIGDGYYKIKVKNGKIVKIFYEKDILLGK